MRALQELGSIGVIQGFYRGCIGLCKAKESYGKEHGTRNGHSVRKGVTYRGLNNEQNLLVQMRYPIP